MRLHVLIFAVVLSSAFFVVPSQAQAGWFEFFFPMLKDTSDDPATTLRAPFAEQEEAAEGEQGGGDANANNQSPSNQTVPFHLAHRSDKEIAQWVTSKVSEAITFTEVDHAAELASLKINFDPHGWQEYTKFLQDTNIMKVMESDRYQLRSYVKDDPLLLNEGPVSNRYRWLYEVWVDISYLDRNVSNYKDVEPQNRTLKVLVQIGRSPKAKNEAGLLMERWSGTVKAAK